MKKSNEQFKHLPKISHVMVCCANNATFTRCDKLFRSLYSSYMTLARRFVFLPDTRRPVDWMVLCATTSFHREAKMQTTLLN